ncbi:MAG: hypothetical protein KJO82_00325 [Gammaproteobacteria bacterium]|nr:hypothetical protein [Gammaproteobacteria bacterium]
MNHRVGQYVFAAVAGCLVAIFAYRWVMNPEPRLERERQEAVVAQSRERLNEVLALGELEIVDPLAADRKVGKTYVYRNDGGWEISGYYRRNEADLWHPYLMQLDAELNVTHLRVSDTALMDRAENAAVLEVLP